MGSFFLTILVDLLTGATQRRLAAAEAFGVPPGNPAAWRYRSVALCLFMAASALLLAAALADTVGGARWLSEVLGWCGIAGLQACVFCGVRYAIVNEAVLGDDRDHA